jgi:hypothetical protein
MSLPDKAIDEFMAIFEKEYGKKITRQQAFEWGSNLVNLFKVLLESQHKENLRKQKLKDNPKGFHLTDGTYSCYLCGTQVSGDTSWYDKYGTKCITCQSAVNKHLIPASVFKGKDSWYSIWEFDYYFDIKAPRVRKYLKEGKLRARTVLGASGRPYFQLFLIKDNPGVLPEKPKGSVVKTEDGMIHVDQPKVPLPLS